MPKPKKGRAKRQAEVSPAKARKILRDGEIGGRALTARQRRFFGARAGGAPVKRKK